MAEGVMAVLLCTSSALAAALLGVAAARRNWWIHMILCGVGCLLLLIVGAFIATGGYMSDLPWWANLIGYAINVHLILTAWSVHRDGEKQRAREGAR